MTDSKKRRMSLLDNLASASAPTAAPNLMSGNRALRSARDAVDGHNVWELDPNDIDDTRIVDRLAPEDVADLRASIEANGQSVPILVRRHPSDANRYLLVYGRRRLEAIKSSEAVQKVRALIANLDDSAAVRAQVSENTARRDLSYIERALFARELLESAFGSQAQVAEVLNISKSAISMALSVVRAIGPDLARAIGPAHGVGRPRWEALAKEISENAPDPSELIRVASVSRAKAEQTAVGEHRLVVEAEDEPDPSLAAFEAVERHAKKSASTARTQKHQRQSRDLAGNGRVESTVQRTKKGVRMDIRTHDAAFADWLEAEAQTLVEELHERWQQGA